MKKLQIFILCLTFFICLSFVACSNSTNSESLGDQSNTSEKSSIVNNPLNRKIVYTVSMSLKANDVSFLKDMISEKSNALGGYIEKNNEDFGDGKCTRASVTYRIPTEKLDEFIDTIEGVGEIESKNVSTLDITTTYVNAEAQKSALVERKLLLEQMLDDTALSASDRINIINEISAVNTELQELEITINKYDSDINYSTVNITIEEKATFLDIFVPIAIFISIFALLPCSIILFTKLAKRLQKKSSKDTVSF